MHDSPLKRLADSERRLDEALADAHRELDAINERFKGRLGLKLVCAGCAAGFLPGFVGGLTLAWLVLKGW